MPNYFIFHLASFFFIGLGVLASTLLLGPDYFKEVLLPKIINGQISNVLPILGVTLVLHIFIYHYGFSNKETLNKIFSIIKEDKKGSFGKALKIMMFGDKDKK